MNTSINAHKRGLAAATLKALLLAVAVSTAGPVAAATAESPLPASATPFEPARQLLAWVGTGRASVFVDGAWQRAPSHDYEFSVTQRRYAEHWESIKVQHRRHPEYDGRAGERDQVHYFNVQLPATASPSQPGFELRSSFGDGAGRFDTGFRNGIMEFDARGVSMFAPYNRYRITQNYRYEEGELREVVDLFKSKGGVEAPFMRFEESAALLAPSRFETAPGGR